jgi:hypothetical protein
MKHIEAERYAEAVLVARKAIKQGVEAERARLLAKRHEYLGSIVAGGEVSDPTEKDVEKKLARISVLRCQQDGKTFLIYHPEKWLEVFDKTFACFKDRYGDEALQLVRLRYVYGWTTVRIAEEKKISRRAYNNQRDKFLAMLLQHTLQAGLLQID